MGKKMEKELLVTDVKQSVDFYKDLIAALPGHVCWKNKEGIFLGSNVLHANNLGFNDVNELIGKMDQDIFVKADAELIRQHDLEVLETGKRKIFEESVLLHSGEKKVFLSEKKPLFSENELIGILCVSIDMTAERLKKDKLKEEKYQTEKILENILSSLPGHVYWKDRNFTYSGCNLIQAQSGGCSHPREMLGKTDYDMPWKKDADLIRAIDTKVMDTGETVTVEEPSTLANGKEAIFLTKKMPLRGQNGEVEGIIGISFDITAEKLQEELTRERLETVKLIAASMAHELRTPMASINFAIGAIEKHLPELVDCYQQHHSGGRRKLQQLQQFPQKVKNEIGAISTFVDMLLLNVKGMSSEYKLSPISMQGCLDEVIERYPFSSHQRELIKICYIGDDLIVLGNQLLIVHVFFNLMKNALYHLLASNKDDMVININVDTMNRQVKFRDNGTGIPKENLAFIFERFYTKTKHGTGVGLAFCKMVMEYVGGNIRCHSQLGEYTEFVLTFPQLGEENEVSS